MYRLLMDTALDYSYLAILRDDEILFESYEMGNKNHSETLMPKLEKALKDNNIKLRDMEEVYTGIGPGSYTGVRIAVVVSKMIAAMNGVKLFKFSSLALLSASTIKESYPFIDCRRGNCYVSHFKYEDGKLKRLMEDEIVSQKEFFLDKDESLIVREGKPDPLKIIHSEESVLVDDPNALSPNYLQLVEAERIKMGLK